MEDSSDLNDSDVDELLDNGMEHMFVLLASKEFAERKKRKPPWSKVGRLCIARNRALGHDLLMRDYFIEVPTYPAHFFIFATECGGLFSLRSSKLARRKLAISSACEM
jgi:hypothetical protein